MPAHVLKRVWLDFWCRRRLTREVDYVIHCAASISFDEHIHTLLTNNYEVCVVSSAPGMARFWHSCKRGFDAVICAVMALEDDIMDALPDRILHGLREKKSSCVYVTRLISAPVFPLVQAFEFCNELRPQLCTLLLQAKRNVADLAAAMGKLRAFVHLSTAYVNCDRPRGSHVEEMLYPLDLSACRPQGA